MAVNNYIRNKCNYNINKLSNDIYLYDFKSPILDYITDENETNATSNAIKGACYQIYCETVEYTSTSSNDNRFSFENTLTVTILEEKEETFYNLLDKIIKGSWMVLFKNVDGDIFIMNGEYPVMVSYQYVFNDEKTPNILTITFKVLQNVPTLNYRASIDVSDIWRSKPCGYNASRIESLKMIDKKRCEFDTNSFIITQKGEGALKDIEFNPLSMSFTDSFDGQEYTHTLSFSIPFDSYIYFFHYNLLEYLDNRYYALITTTNGNHIFSGFRRGLFPAYTINSSEGIINITLTSKSNDHSTISANEYTLITVEFKEYIKLFGECIDNNYTYTLLQEKNTDNYYCLNGFESEYPDYNIVESYNKFDTKFGFKLIDYSYDCLNECAINGLPSSIVFSKNVTSKTYTVSSKCDISFEYDNTLCTVDYQGTTLTVNNLSENEGTYTINVISEDGTVYKILCLVTFNVDADQTIHITAQEQKVTVNPINGITNITSVDTTLRYTPNQYGNGYVFSVPRNNSTAETVNYTITIKYNDNTTETILIIQDKLYEALIATDQQQCYDGDLYTMYKRLIGYTEDSISIEGGFVKGELLENDSISCETYDQKENIDSICYEGHLYDIVKYSLQGVTIKEQAELDGESCTDVGYDKWIINTGKTICVDGLPYYKEELWISNDNSKFYILYPIEERASTVEAPESNICNVVGDIDKTVYKWVYTNGSYCLEDTDVEGVDYNCEKTSDVTYIEGDKSTYMCYKGNKYRVIANLISTHCDGDYRVYGYQQGSLIEENCEECGYESEQTCEISKETVVSNITVYYDGKDVEYNEYAIPTVSGFVTTTVIDKKCNTHVETAFTQIEDYTITYSPSGENTTNDNRDIIATVKYNDEKIGEFSYIQRLNPNNTGGGDEPSEPDTPDEPSEPENNGRTLSFNWYKGTESVSTFRLNGTRYSATTASYTVTLDELGIDTLTNSSGSFSGSTIVILNSYPDTSNVTDMNKMFYMCSGLTSLDLSNWNVSNVIDFGEIFYSCVNLESVNLNGWNTANATEMDRMFSACSGLTSLNLNSFNTSGTTNMSYMFYQCSNLTSLDLSNFNTSKLTKISRMFEGCSSLNSLDLSGWDLTNVTSTTYVFNKCTALTSIYCYGCNQTTIDKLNSLKPSSCTLIY